MQFLSDVYLRCPDCDGRRFRAEVLDVKLVRGPRQLSIADVLDLTVSEAVDFFHDDREVLARLQPHRRRRPRLRAPGPAGAHAVGRRGAAAEAGRLPGRRGGVAARSASRKKGTLFLFDEPTTGLHFDDIAKLMRALRKLLDAGHSLLVIEHNLDVIRAADWIVDLGPEGGEAGGEVVCDRHARRREGATPRRTPARALRDYETSLGCGTPRPRRAGAAALLRARAGAAGSGRRIRIVNANEHNLKTPERRHPARQVQRHHRRVAVRARARWRSTSCSTKASGATSKR